MAITGVSAVILLVLCSIHLLSSVATYYFVGIIFGFIGLIARSIFMWNHIDKKECIDEKGNIKYRWYDVNEQCKIVIRAYYIGYPIFIILTILAFISLAILTLDAFFYKPTISLILIASTSMLVGFILRSPKDLT